LKEVSCQITSNFASGAVYTLFEENRKPSALDTIGYIGLAVLGYLVGSFPSGVVLSKYKFRIDVREMGSGNIGATNVTRVFGWGAGILTLATDFLKSFLPLYLLSDLYPGSPWLTTSTGISLVIGHCFSAFLGLKGGKGVATSLGCVAVVAPWLAVGATAVYIVLLAIYKISALGSLGGVAVAVGYLAVVQPSWSVATLVLALIGVVLFRHWSNIQRLFKATKEGERS